MKTATGQIRAALLTSGKDGGTELTLQDIAAPRPHAPRWVVIRPALSGICGADLDLLKGRRGRNFLERDDSAIIPGHEMVGVVTEARGTRWVREGQRVLVEPTLRCIHKGLPECTRCKEGDGHLCENRDRLGPGCSGEGVGFSASTGGGWAEALLVHEEMLLPADTISDQRAVLAEPCASALHAVQRWKRRGDRAVVIGTGTVSRLVVATLRRLHRDLDITVIYESRHRDRPRFGWRHRALPKHIKHDPSADCAAIEKMGAQRVWRGTPESMIDRAAELVNARRLRAEHDALPVLDRGFDVAFDCRGTDGSADMAMRLLAPGGTLILMQRPGANTLNLPLLWSREITIAGASSYGREADGWRTFAVVRDWLTDPAFPVDGMVTHRYTLDEISTAVATAHAGPALGAVKVVIQGADTQVRPAEPTLELSGTPDMERPLVFEGTAQQMRSRANAETADSSN